MTAAGNWCSLCRHYIVPGPDKRGSWVHYSDDDWKGLLLPNVDICECASLLRPCVPERDHPIRDLLRMQRHRLGP